MTTKDVVMFDADSIELSITGAIKKNTLPAIRGEWATWLESFKASELETDEDFTAAALFVTECKRVEGRLDEIRENALKGQVFKAIKELEEMKETTRQKRLEFDRAVTMQKDKKKSEAIQRAVADISAKLAALEYKQAIDVDGALRAAIKGKSSIAKMQEAMVQASAEIEAVANTYCARFKALRGTVTGLYAAAGEPVTDSELDLLVRNHFEMAPEHAKLILGQKKVARDQAALDAAKAKPAEIPAAPAPQAAPVNAVPAMPADMPVKTMRFTATFRTDRPSYIKANLEAMGAQDVTFEESK